MSKEYTPQGYIQQQGNTGGASSDPGVRLHQRFHAKRKFIPEEWDGNAEDAPPTSQLTVDLGGERVRAVVRLVVDVDKVVVELFRLPFSKNHTFRQHDFVPCERRRGQETMGLEVWVAARNAATQADLDNLVAERNARISAEQAVTKTEKTPRRARRKAT